VLGSTPYGCPFFIHGGTMTTQEKQAVMQFLQKFCSDNVGNRLNEWIIEAFLNRAAAKMKSMEDQKPQGQQIDRTELSEILK